MIDEVKFYIEQVCATRLNGIIQHSELMRLQKGQETTDNIARSPVNFKGTGFTISSRYVLTACHVAQTAYRKCLDSHWDFQSNTNDKLGGSHTARTDNPIMCRYPAIMTPAYLTGFHGIFERQEPFERPAELTPEHFLNSKFRHDAHLLEVIHGHTQDRVVDGYCIRAEQPAEGDRVYVARIQNKNNRTSEFTFDVLYGHIVTVKPDRTDFKYGPISTSTAQFENDFWFAFELDNPKEQLWEGNSGTPIFDEYGNILGVLSTGSPAEMLYEIPYYRASQAINILAYEAESEYMDICKVLLRDGVEFFSANETPEGLYTIYTRVFNSLESVGMIKGVKVDNGYKIVSQNAQCYDTSH